MNNTEYPSFAGNVQFYPRPVDDRKLKEHFIERFQAVSGEYFNLPGESEIDRWGMNFFRDNNIRKVVVAGPPMGSEIREFLRDKVEVLADFAEDNLTREQTIEVCAMADAGITGADGMIADSGSVVCGSLSHGDRLVSLLPPIHIVAAFGVPLFEDFDRFMKITPKNLTYAIITGPSRTADIEKQIVLGAHGPRRMIVWGV